LFNQEGVYGVDTISHALPEKPLTYSDILLKVRIDILRKLAAEASVLDVCCATGQHLNSLSDIIEDGVGLDFSLLYLETACHSEGKANTGFVCSNAKRMPFVSKCFDVAYSFSSLYIISNVEEVVSEMARVLKPRGKCVLDLGNCYSLNVIVAHAYHKQLGWAQQFPISVPKMKRIIRAAGLKIVEHRAFQILPLWEAELPKWMGVFLWRGWAAFLSKEFAGKILDEWISELPGLRFFAFRHVFVCEKLEQGMN
jgi:ubiquinone/menaquinone biosynthesis C-methylase UbiE